MIAKKLIPHQKDCNTVLIISQDVDMTRVWTGLFRQRGCDVLSEESAFGGVQASRLLAPALILLDLDLPHEERLLLCRQLRASTNGTLLLINASYKSVDVLEYHHAGVDETIADSISPMALLVKSLAWLARQDWIVPRNSQSTQVWA